MKYTDSEILAKLFEIAVVLYFDPTEALSMYKRELMGTKSTEMIQRPDNIQPHKKGAKIKERTDFEILSKLYDIAALLQFNKAKALALFKKEFMAVETAATPQMTPHDNIGDLYTIDDFRYMCQSRALVNRDGFGHYATTTHTSDIIINPSNCESGRMDKVLKEHPRFTHIAWYNK